ncbi:MAG: Omp28-related outer membrane protein [Bacteroidales bacterium]|nr:Omp28-related outer membrane protein [Bacteroidales bacterium]
MKRYGLKAAMLMAGLGLCMNTLYGQSNVSVLPQPKAVLLEEQTGMGCGNCPDGAALITDLKARLGDVLQVISYHVGHYAEPNGGQPDFRTDDGDSLLEFWGEYGYPQGEVDRIYFPFSPGVMAFGRSRWTASIESRMADTATLNLYVSAGLDAATRELTVEVEGYYVKASAAAENYLHVALIQNHVNGPQNQAPAGYLHEHMFRGFLTPLWGDTLPATAAGSAFKKTYTYTVPADYRGVKAEVRNLEIVVFVTEGRDEVLNSTGCKPALRGIDDPAAATLTLAALPRRYCARDFEAALESRYNDTIKHIAYEVTLNGAKTAYEMDVEVPPYEKRALTLRIDAYDPAAQNTAEFKLTALNGAAYNGGAVKVSFNEPLPVVSPLIVEMSTDAHPEECYWYVADQDGNVLYEFDYTGNEQVSVTEGLKLDSGLYSLYFLDTKWDGWQVKPRGSYKIKDIDGKMVAQNYDLRGKGDIVSVRVTQRKTSADTTAAVETVEALQNVRLYPNPASEVVYLSGRAAETGLWTWTLTDIQGRVFGNGTLSTASGQTFDLAIPLQDVAKGLYLINLQTQQTAYVFRMAKR